MKIKKRMILKKIIALQEQDEDKELQHIFSEITGNEGTGPEIDSTLGKAIKKVWQSELSKDKLKRYHEKYKISSKCLYLKLLMMDSEIYHNISKPSSWCKITKTSEKYSKSFHSSGGNTQHSYWY